MTAAARRFVTLTSTSLPRPFLRPQQKLPSLLNTPTTRSFSQTTFHNFRSTSLNMGVHNIADLKAYQSDIIKADASTLVVLDCFAVWCGPCKTIAPTIAKYSEEYPTAKFFKVDVDEASDVAQELGIRAMPTFLFFKNGEKVGEVVGANAKAIEATIKQHL